LISSPGPDTGRIYDGVGGFIKTCVFKLSRQSLLRKVNSSPERERERKRKGYETLRLDLIARNYSFSLLKKVFRSSYPPRPRPSHLIADSGPETETENREGNTFN
jgi:hypothetical protein